MSPLLDECDFIEAVGDPALRLRPIHIPINQYARSMIQFLSAAMHRATPRPAAELKPSGHHIPVPNQYTSASSRGQNLMASFSVPHGGQRERSNIRVVGI